ncbi:3-methyl-2-oxobutanoate hydroxymethyltransferase [bacterium]|nr:3-methyl-2-oxobutanoate hydroxymethyltransferase [bacterium]
MSSRVTVATLREMKAKGERITMLTAYDALVARAVDAAGVDVILVGDSLGEVVQGHDSTLPVRLRETLYHTEIVARCVRRALVVADMPFLSYGVTVEATVRHAGLCVKEAGAAAVKLEGGALRAEEVRRLADCGIPVMGHVGTLPSWIHRYGAYRVQGKTLEAGRAILEDALALEAAGAFAVVIEVVPPGLARVITRRLSIPTIGIGAGPHCDGQVLVTQDMLGFDTGRSTRFVRRYETLGARMAEAISRYAAEVREGRFPDATTSYSDGDVDWGSLE